MNFGSFLAPSAAGNSDPVRGLLHDLSKGVV